MSQDSSESQCPHLVKWGQLAKRSHGFFVLNQSETWATQDTTPGTSERTWDRATLGGRKTIQTQGTLHSACSCLRATMVRSRTLKLNNTPGISEDSPSNEIRRL